METTCVYLKKIMLNEINQTETNTIMIPLICGIQNIQQTSNCIKKETDADKENTLVITSVKSEDEKGNTLRED